jgi:hypothetical protein
VRPPFVETGVGSGADRHLCVRRVLLLLLLLLPALHHVR